RNRGRRISRDRRSASCAAEGDIDHAVHGNGDRVSTRRGRGTGPFCAGAADVSAYGRSPDFKRRCKAGPYVEAGHARPGNRRTVVWRNEKWLDGRGCGGLLSPGTGAGFSFLKKTRDATRLQDALLVGADGGAAHE